MPARAGIQWLARCGDAFGTRTIARRGGGHPVRTHALAVGLAGRLRCDARHEVAPHNSLRALRALRSDKCGESVHDARACGTRRPRPCASQPPLNRPARVPPAARAAVVPFLAHATAVFAKGRVGRPTREFWRRGAKGSRQARVSAPRELTRRTCLSAANEVSEASCATGREAEHHRAACAQRRPPKLERGGLPARPFAATTLAAKGVSPAMV